MFPAANRFVPRCCLMVAGLSTLASEVEVVSPHSHRAVLSGVAPLVYVDAPSHGDDVAPFVRSASAVRRVGKRLWIVQDDVNALALRDGSDVRVVLLPAGPNGERSFSEARGNKSHKLDLEASVALPDGRLLAFGSGSTQSRERLVVVGPDESVAVRDAGELYDAMRRRVDFSGSELNIEGAVLVGDVLRFFQRGNGAVAHERKPINATADVKLDAFLRWLDADGPMPPLERIITYELGAVDGVPWTFTDATVVGEQVVFVGAAEASPDTYRDGEVVGACVGLLGPGGARVFPVVDESGALVKIKLEGIEYRPGTSWVFDVVADVDNPDVPALIGTVTLTAR